MREDSRTLSRRSFFRTGAGAAAGALTLGGYMRAMAEAAKEGPAPMTYDPRPMKLGVIGCGAQGMRLIETARKIPGLQVTAVSDLCPMRLEAAKTAAGADAKAFANYEELLKSDAQAVVIATPLNLHHPMTMKAFAAGKDVYVERTMARTIDQCKEMIVASFGNSRVLQVGHALRYHPSFYIAYKFAHKGELGKVQEIRCQCYRKADDGFGRRPLMCEKADGKAFGFATPEQLANWHLFKEFSGGVVTELGNDQLDLANWMLGDESGDAAPVSVSGQGKLSANDGRTVFDDVQLTFEYPGGVKVTYETAVKEFKPAGWETAEFLEGARGRIVLAHLSPYAGLFMLKEGEKDELWMNLATRADMTDEVIVPKGSKKPIVIGKPTPNSVYVAGLDATNLLDGKTSQPVKPPLELALYEFKVNVLDRKIPTANALVGLKSAAASIKAVEAMEKKAKVELSPSIFEL